LPQGLRLPLSILSKGLWASSPDGDGYYLRALLRPELAVMRSRLPPIPLPHLPIPEHHCRRAGAPGPGWSRCRGRPRPPGSPGARMSISSITNWLASLSFARRMRRDASGPVGRPLFWFYPDSWCLLALFDHGSLTSWTSSRPIGIVTLAPWIGYL